MPIEKLEKDGRTFVKLYTLNYGWKDNDPIIIDSVTVEEKAKTYVTSKKHVYLKSAENAVEKESYPRTFTTDSDKIPELKIALYQARIDYFKSNIERFELRIKCEQKNLSEALEKLERIKDEYAEKSEQIKSVTALDSTTC